MVRIARVVSLSCPFHVTHRGNHRESIFFDEEDRFRYLEILRVAAAQAGLRVWTYCLMPNHVHLIVAGERRDSMARALGAAHRRYSRSVNKRRGWTGHLWANRFYSTPLDERHLWSGARYVELNPVRAGIVARPEEYAWSSAPAHVFGTSDPLLSADRPFPGRIEDWSRWLLEGIGDPRIAVIRANTSTGRPSGSAEFVSLLERRLGRVLQPRKPGRKKQGVHDSKPASSPSRRAPGPA